MGFGGGSVDIPQRDLSSEWGSLKTLFKGGKNQYGTFYKPKAGAGKADPLLRSLYPAAEEFLKSPPSELSTAIQDEALAQLRGGPSDILNWLSGEGADQLKAPSALLTDLTSDAQIALSLGGKLSPEEERYVAQKTREGFAARGNVLGNAALGTELLDRDIYSRGREAERRQYAMGVEQLGESDVANRFGLLGGIESLLGADTARRLALAEGAEGMGLQEQLAKFQVPQDVLRTGVSSYTALTNPLLAYASDLFSSNQNASAAQSIAGANKSAGTSSGIMSTIGSIAGAVGMAY
jgi:hypothetical protein